MNTSEAMKKNILTLCLLFTCIWGNSQTFQLEAANADSTALLQQIQPSFCCTNVNGTKYSTILHRGLKFDYYQIFVSNLNCQLIISLITS